jgi:hypothetical protein
MHGFLFSFPPLNAFLILLSTEKRCTVFIYTLKVHKIEKFFGSEFEFYTISLLVMLKY